MFIALVMYNLREGDKAFYNMYNPWELERVEKEMYIDMGYGMKRTNQFFAWYLQKVSFGK